MLRLRRMQSLQRFASVRVPVCKHHPLPREPLRHDLRSQRDRAPPDQSKPPLDRRTGRGNEPHHQGRDHQAPPLRRRRAATPTFRAVPERLQLRPAPEDPRSSHATRELLLMATRDKAPEQVRYRCAREGMFAVGLGTTRTDNGTGLRNASVKGALVGSGATSIDMRTSKSTHRPYVERTFGRTPHQAMMQLKKEHGALHSPSDDDTRIQLGWRVDPHQRLPARAQGKGRNHSARPLRRSLLRADHPPGRLHPIHRAGLRRPVQHRGAPDVLRPIGANLARRFTCESSLSARKSHFYGSSALGSEKAIRNPAAVTKPAYSRVASEASGIMGSAITTGSAPASTQDAGDARRERDAAYTPNT